MYLALALSTTGSSPAAENSDAASALRFQVAPPPPDVVEDLSLAPFYKKHVDVQGFSIVSSAAVSDYALLEAAYLIQQMIGHRPDVLRELARNKVRFSVMAYNELTTDIPEHSDLRPQAYWDRRARGLGATRIRPSVSCGEENLLGYPGDPYGTENILIHEFAHAIHLLGLNSLDDTFDARLNATFTAAIDSGLWEGTYASTNKEEYWAEGVQSWFDTNRQNDHDHNHVDTRSELKSYDPRLAKLLAEVFGDGDWRYTHPSQRKNLAHLRGYDLEQAPTFAWPEKISDLIDRLHQAGRGELAANEADPVWSEASEIPLDEQTELRSKAGGEATSLVIVNGRKEPLNLHWIDFDGNRRDDGRITAGRFRLLNTFRDHVWLVTDRDGNPVAAFRSQQPNERAVIHSKP